MIRVSSSAAWT